MSNASKILIVEDEAVVALAMEKQLTRLGFEVIGTCDNGLDALQKAAEESPQLVLMDIKINGDLDGVDTVKQLRAVFDIPVIYLTSYSDEATLERAKVTEPFGYLLKPFDDLTLKTTFDLALHKHKMVLARA
jgi:CheY-like chemotaxis protein